jgi:predicted PurR-regulated permease PerM
MVEDAKSLRLPAILRPPIGSQENPTPKAAHGIGPNAASAESNSTASCSVVEEAEVLQGSLKAGSVAQVVIAIVAAVGLLYLLKFVMVTILVALLLAFILEPLVNLLSQIAVPRAAGALLAVVLAAGALGSVGYFLYGRLDDFAAELPRYSQRIKQSLTQIQEPLRRLEKSTRSVASPPKDGSEPVPVTVQEGSALSRLVSANSGAIWEAMLAIGFIPFLTYFMLTWKVHAHSATVQLFPEENRAIARRTIGRISAMIRGFIVGNVTVGIIGALVCTIVFWLVGIPYFYFLGVISGFVSLIPSFGVLLAFLPPLAGGIGYLTKAGILIVLVAVIGTHTTTMNVLYPKLVGHRVRLNPLAVLLSLLFWAWIWGALGLLLAVPIVGAIKIICDNVGSLKRVAFWLGD